MDEATRTSNPLLTQDFPIPFASVRAEHVEPAIRAVLDDLEDTLAALRRAEPPYYYDNLLGRLDAAEVRANRVIHTVAHLNGVRQDAVLREAWSAVLPELAAFEARKQADPNVYRVLNAYAATDEARQLDEERARHLSLTLDDMRRAGAGLDAERRARVEALRSELASLQNTFENHVLDGTNAYHLDITDDTRLEGIPDSAKQRAKEAAQAAGVEGWRFTLHAPSYLAVAQHAHDRELRETLYRARDVRAMSDGRDNRTVIPRILKVRREIAQRLGYDHWADLQTEPRMAGSGDAARTFERDLWNAVEPHFRAEAHDLATFARDELGIDPIEAWDVAYVIEHLRKARYDLDDEMLRPWFSMDRVQRALFDLAHDLFGITITPTDREGAWHPDVEVYAVHREDGTHIGSFYTDWYPRDDKRGGAWMMPLIHGGPTPDGFEPHLAAISGNLTPPSGDAPALLTHDEVTTIFHEFGHLLHHLLSETSVRALSGTSVPWDFVELPSQIMENWLWEDDALTRIARHVDDDSPLPDELRDRMHAARTFASAYAMARQISFGTVDLALHVDHDPGTGGDPLAMGHEVLTPFQIRPELHAEGFLPAFTHIFAGGYAAGYYSYLWSEMLEADAFTRFKQEGLFSRTVGEELRREILSRGNGAPPADMVRAFLGRDPDVRAMLSRNLGADRVA